MINPDTGRPGDLFQLLECNTTADCTQNCKLCDGSLYHLHRDTLVSPDPFQCICEHRNGNRIGRCKKFGKCNS